MCEMMDANTDINIKVDLKENKKKNSRECSEGLDNQRRKLIKREGFISQDQYFHEQIKKVHEEHSKGKEFELLESHSPILSKGCEETNNASTDKFGNNILINSHNNEEDIKPIYSRFRKQDKHKKKKRRNKSGKTTVNNNHVQDGVIRCNDSNQMKSCNETITTIGPDEKDIKSDKQQIVNQVKNSNPCECQSLINDLPCNCKYLRSQDGIFADYEKIIKENIPDNKIPINPKKTIMEKVTDVFDMIKTIIYGYESDEQFDDDKIKSRNPFYFWRKIPLDIRKLDPLAPNSISHWPSNSTATISHNYESNESNGDSSRFSNNTNYMNNNCQDNNQYNSLSTESSTQYTYPHCLPKSIHLLVLIITFEYHQLGQPNSDTCHSKGYHPIVRHFGNPEMDRNKAFQFVYDSIMNCWANSWKVALVISINPMRNFRELNYFFEEIRKEFEREILDIIFLQPVQPSNPTGYLSRLDVYVAKSSYKETWLQKFESIMDKIIKKVIIKKVTFQVIT
ncbi:hypothetical protein C1645_497905 [Glomus cerebriforme]|uniref:Uncharacterized protein n=1 Tax=Glomus cerebriforme TaxID=658196 RepID=A0A397S8G5_9GLOM|nr:hypothetical protein C1645_497905 [Glomus cerebriforme]